MQNRLSLDGPMPKFWPPKPSGFWSWLLGPIRRKFLRKTYRISEFSVEGFERLRALPPTDSALLCPNHSFAGDGSLMAEVSLSAPRRFNIMAAWQLFTGHAGLDGWLLQRMGCFSVDREGADRRALKQAIEILTTGRFLLVFPEGENYHCNQRLTPIREGVAFMAASAQKDLGDKGRVHLFPVGVRYTWAEDVKPRIEEMLVGLEKRFTLRPKDGVPLHERVLALGEVLLTIQEKQRLGEEGSGPLAGRLSTFIEALLTKHETALLGKTHSGETVPVRVKKLRAHLLDMDPRPANGAEILGDLHFTIQLFSYPGDYVTENPSLERVGETLEKFDEDLAGREALHLGRRKARVKIGEAIDVKAAMEGKKLREVVGKVTDELEARITGLMRELA